MHPSPVLMPFSPERRRRYRLHLQIGAALSLGLVLLAFSLPVPPEAPAAPGDIIACPIPLWDLPQTDVAKPPPPPPAAPPPEEVPDETAIEDETIQTLELILEGTTVVTGPPALPPPPPPPPVQDPPAPPPPPEVATDEVVAFLPIEDQPVLIGGLEGLQKRVTYPEAARRAEAEGTVHIRFIVDTEGRVTAPEVLRSPHPALSEAALKAVIESRFTPGQQRGRAVSVQYTLPVRFVLR